MLILTTFLTSCAGVKTLEIFKKEVPRENLNLDKPTPLELENLKWIIITSENADEVFKKMKEQFLIQDGFIPLPLYGSLVSRNTKISGDRNENTKF